MAFFLNWLRGTKEDPKQIPSLTKDGKTYYSVQSIARCCTDLKISLPATDVITIVRNVWARRKEGPFSDLMIGLFDSRALKDPRELEVILVPSSRTNTNNKLLTKQLGEALEKLIAVEVSKKNDPRYLLPKFQVNELLRKELSKSLETIPEPLTQTLFQVPSFGSVKDARKFFFEGRCTSDFEINELSYLCSGSGDVYGLYRVGLSGKRTERAWDLMVLFAARCNSDPCVVKVNILPLETHLTLDPSIPRVIIELLPAVPLGCFIESLHLLLSEKEFGEILDGQVCIDQPEGWATVSMCRTYPQGGLPKESDECIFSISSSSDKLNWGPNGAFSGVLTLGDTATAWSNPFRNPWYQPSEKSEKIECGLIVARPIPGQSSFHLDYGWVPEGLDDLGGKRFVLHPLYLEKYVASFPYLFDPNEIAKPRREILTLESLPKGGLVDYIYEATSEKDYHVILADFCFIKGSQINVDYEL